MYEPLVPIQRLQHPRSGRFPQPRRGPDAVPLDAEVVPVHGNPEEAVLAPVGAPGVATDPVLLAVLLAPAHHGDLVVDDGVAHLLPIDAARVLLESVGHVHPTTWVKVSV